ncbi:hypothetical protein Acr_06g0004830 [Actinidia rufa]|uniref:Uncharacterized protein n=1 Tax=Actinidia rufa TaxID=165716 RepID=A0A7J0EQ44_9ERIC|nr:hypothetical protein Acr_06g0004830 [Actinidia rufa]
MTPATASTTIGPCRDPHPSPTIALCPIVTILPAPSPKGFAVVGLGRKEWRCKGEVVGRWLVVIIGTSRGAEEQGKGLECIGGGGGGSRQWLDCRVGLGLHLGKADEGQFGDNAGVLR